MNHKDKDRELGRIVSEYSQASRRIDEILNEPLIRIKAIREDRLKKTISQIKALYNPLLEALEGIIQIGKRDMSNPKYDSYFKFAKQAIINARDKFIDIAQPEEDEPDNNLNSYEHEEHCGDS